MSWKADVTRSLLVPAGAPGTAMELTEPVNQIVYQSEVGRGLCYLFTPYRDTTLEVDGPAPGADSGGLPRNQVTLLVVDRRLFLAPGQRVVLRELAGEAKPARRRLMVRVLDGTEPLAEPFPEGEGGTAHTDAGPPTAAEPAADADPPADAGPTTRK